MESPFEYYDSNGYSGNKSYWGDPICSGSNNKPLWGSISSKKNGGVRFALGTPHGPWFMLIPSSFLKLIVGDFMINGVVRIRMLEATFAAWWKNAG